MTLAFLAALLIVNVALRAWPVRRPGDGLTAVECAFLRGGTRAAVLACLATLHVRVAPSDEVGEEYDESAESNDFVQAVAEAGDPPTGTWGIARTRPVRQAAADLRERLAVLGLLAPTGHWVIARCALVAVPVVAALALVDRLLEPATVVASAVALGLAVALWLAPRRTIAGWRALRAERQRYERITLAEQAPLADARAVGMLVALHGQPAFEEVIHQTIGPPPLPRPPERSTAELDDGEPQSSLKPRRLML